MTTRPASKTTPSAPKPAKSQRTREIALIKIAQAQLQLDDAAYRAMLHALTGQSSARDLGDAGRARVLEHLIASGARITWSRRRAARLSDDRAPLVRKVRALLLSLGNAPDAYADALAQRMYRIDRFEWCDPEQLRGIVTALSRRLEKLRAAAEGSDGNRA